MTTLILEALLEFVSSSSFVIILLSGMFFFGSFYIGLRVFVWMCVGVFQNTALFVLTMSSGMIWEAEWWLD